MSLPPGKTDSGITASADIGGLEPAAVATLSAPPPLDPDYAAAVATDAAPRPDWLNDPPAVLRQAYTASRLALRADAMAACTVAPFTLDDPGIRNRPRADGLVITPPGAASRRAIAYFHGGGWVVGAPETHVVPTSHLAAATGLRVYSLRYRLAPEHPWPAQRDDGLRAIAALLAGPVGAAAVPDSLVLMGDSAGAGLCLWLDHSLDAALRRRIAGVVGIYGAFGLRDSDSLDRFGLPGTGLTPAEIRTLYAWLGNPHDLPPDSGFNVILTARGDGPPVYLAAAGRDPLLDDSRRLHDRLVRQGRDSMLDIAPALPHGHMHYAARVPAVADAVRRIGGWVRHLPG